MGFIIRGTFGEKGLEDLHYVPQDLGQTRRRDLSSRHDDNKQPVDLDFPPSIEPDSSWSPWQADFFRFSETYDRNEE